MTAQDGPRGAPDLLKTARESPKRVLRRPQDRTKTAQEASQKAQDAPPKAPMWFQHDPRGSETAQENPKAA